MRFRLILGRLAILKKNGGPIISNFWGRFFQVFWGKKISYLKKNIYTSVRTKKLHKNNFFNFFKNLLKFIFDLFLIFFWLKLCMIVYCSTGDTSLRDFYTMTLYVPLLICTWFFRHQVGRTWFLPSLNMIFTTFVAFKIKIGNM